MLIVNLLFFCTVRRNLSKKGAAMEYTYTVSDMTCNHCKQAIEAALHAVDGVASAVVDVDTKTVTVTGTASDAAITQAITEAGYTPSV
jgi:copper chaperone